MDVCNSRIKYEPRPLQSAGIRCDDATADAGIPACSRCHTRGRKTPLSLVCVWVNRVVEALSLRDASN